MNSYQVIGIMSEGLTYIYQFIGPVSPRKPRKVFQNLTIIPG